uniref:Uncharacterized protein n=1 Tax=Solanum tuberosum TaxID=4113 RepID=M0ZK58_SOLTU
MTPLVDNEITKEHKYSTSFCRITNINDTDFQNAEKSFRNIEDQKILRRRRYYLLPGSKRRLGELEQNFHHHNHEHQQRTKELDGISSSKELVASEMEEWNLD